MPIKSSVALARAPRVVPSAWMPSATMRRIIVHWTAGAHKASEFDRGHYHILINDDGELVRGIPVISGNSEKSPVGKKASHTLNCNTGSIGVSMACMGGAAEEPFKPGRWPLTRAQWNALMPVLADLCERYGIAVGPKTVLTHAEVQSNLGIKQRGKWDITRLAFDLKTKGAKACGDRLRRELAAEMTHKPLAIVPAPVIDEDGGEPAEPHGDAQLISVQSSLKGMNYNPGSVEGIWGGMVAGAITGFLNDRGSDIPPATSFAAFQEIAPALTAEITTAEGEGFKRPVSAARESGDPEKINEVAPEAAPVRRSFLVTVWGAICTFFAAVTDYLSGSIKGAWDFFTDHRDDLPSDPGLLQTALGWLGNVPTSAWLLIAAGGLAFVAINLYRGVAKIRQDVATGARP